VLVVDDEPAIRRALRANLAARGYDVMVAATGEEALLLARRQEPNLVLLDLMLPGISGLEVCKALREQWPVPILVLSARGEEQLKVQALDMGADDYLTKPFGMDELLARVRALLRRPASTPLVPTCLTVGRMNVDLEARRVLLDGRELSLTAREFDILAYLGRNAGRVVTHRQLLHEVWGPEYAGETQYLRVFINRLRGKVEDNPRQPRLIVTEPGVGYRLLPAPEVPAVS
jgi:two-component system KDP operon response regulator KdpE